MKIEELMNAGITKEQAEAVKKLWQQELDGNYIPKDKFDAERQKVKDRDTQIAERDKQIADLGKFKGDNEELNKKVAQLAEKNEAAIKEYQEKIQKMEFDSALRSAIGESVYDFTDVLGKLDTTMITVRDGKVVAGLDEQLTQLKQSHPYYFKQTQPNGFNPVGETPQNGAQGEDSGNTYETFAKKLAEIKANVSPVQTKVGEIYFGEKD